MFLLIPIGLLISGLFSLALPVLLGAGYLISRLPTRWLMPYLYIVLIVAIPIVGVLTYVIEMAHGAYPTPGNCVL